MRIAKFKSLSRGKKLFFLLVLGVSIILVAKLWAIVRGPWDRATLSSITGATSIQINYRWTGLSSAAPIEAYYSLQRGSRNFHGKARFSVAGGSPPRGGRAVEDITVPLAVVDKFLKALAKSPMEEGTYHPMHDAFDDTPSYNIDLKVKSETISFFSQSQGDYNVPWGLELNGKTYVVNSAAPGKALEILEPYFKDKVFDKLFMKSHPYE